MFEPLGIAPKEESVYRALLRNPGMGAGHLAIECDMSRAEVARALKRLQERGLVSRAPEKSTRYIPARPDLALQGLVQARRRELEQLDRAAQELLADFHAGIVRGDVSDVIEIVRGSEAFALRYLQLRQSAKTEWLALDKPPYITPAQVCTDAARQQLRDGVPIRAIYAEEVLERPGRLEDIEAEVAEGQQARILREIPVKLAIADGQLALLPLTVEPGAEAALFLHPSPLLHSLVAMFELLWERATPFGDIGNGAAEGTIDEDDRRLLRLMAAGVKDETIARQLGWGGRTLTRRVTQLLQALDAKTRFEAGVKATRRGWI